MRIYTKTGDEGQTGLFGGARVSKDDAQVEAYGAVDELNALLGVARAAGVPAEVDAELDHVQVALFQLGAELAMAPGKEASAMTPPIADDDVRYLEAAIDAKERELPALKTFILPSGADAAARLHLARTVCRRAERRVVTLAGCRTVRGQVIVYLNRLSDLLFVQARFVNHRNGIAEVPWTPERTLARKSRP